MASRRSYIGTPGNGLEQRLQRRLFFQYRSRKRGRRLGTAALTLVSAATFLESLYFGLGAIVYGIQGAPYSFRAWGALAIRTPVAAGSLFITLLVLRHKLSGKGAGSED